MDYHTLLDLVTDLGYRLAMCGAETFRVEESINLILQSYGLNAESFAIPNNLTVSIETPDGTPLTRMRRIGTHGNDLDSLERYSNLSRRICAEKPDPKTAMQWLKQTDSSLIHYNTFWIMLGNALGAAGFSVFFGGNFSDCLIASVCGILVGCVGLLMDRLSANQFFRTISASFLMALLAYGLGVAGVATNADTIIIGTLMILVPGLLFTNAMRDIIYGDTNSGINRIVLVFLIAVAIALGTAAAWNLIAILFNAPSSIPAIEYSASIQLPFCFIGCLGFVILFNIQGPGGLLCALGGTIAWAAYMLTIHITGNDLSAYFIAALVASFYSEVMARIRKYPAISYLVISIFPLIPGASIYYTMNYAVRGDMNAFADKMMHTIAIAGVIAVGVILVSTIFRMWTTWKRNRVKQHK